VQLDVTDRFVDVQQEGIDIAVRSHFAPLPDSELVQRQLLVEPIILVASPGYLSQREAPGSPADLQHHAGLLSGQSASTWTLCHPSGERTQVQPQPAMVANESTVLVHAALAGLGITCLPERMCREAIASARLVPVLPEWNAGTVTTSLVMPHRRGQLPGVRATVEFLVERFREMT
jgi:DNA-binding transcriptional LysR family regulator